MRELVFLLEEPSAEEMLKGILPQILPEEISPVFVVFEGKQDLERQLTKRINGYRNPDARFVVMRDQDSHPDCRVIKANLRELCTAAGHPDSLIRIACRELESFYLADLDAVSKALGVKNLGRYQENKKFREPDKLGSPSLELKQLSKGLYQKISGSRAIGPLLNLDNNRSSSFYHLVSGIRRIAAEMAV